MIARRSRRRGGVLAPLVAALALLLALLPPAPGASAATTGPATITLSRAELSATTLTLSGVVSNAGTSPLDDVTAYLWRSPALLRSPGAITGALAAETTTPGEWRPVADANTADLTDTPLAPGEARSFTVSGDAAALGLGESDTSYWVGVDVHGRLGDGSPQALGSERTLVTRPSAPVPVATVVELSTVPRLVKTDLFIDDSLADELATGRLATLLGTAQERGTDWVVDAGLLAEVRDMADGYRVQTEAGSTEGTRPDVARAWLDRLEALDRARGGLSLAGTPDLDTAAAVGDSSIAERAVRATDGIGLDGARPLVILDRPDAAGLGLAAPLGRRIVALQADAPGVRVDAAGADVVVAVRPGEPLATSPLLDDDALNRRAVEAALGRARGGVVRWIRSAEDLAADTTLAAGFTHTSLDTVGDRDPVPWTPTPRRPHPTVLTEQTLPALRALGTTLEAYGSMAPDAGIGEVADAQVARGASVWWPGPAEQERWLAAIERRLDLPEGDPVTVTAAGQFSMTGSSSEFPLTVTNHLADPVTVRLSVSTDYPQRIWLSPPPPVTIAPGASSTVSMSAESSGGGVVRARVHAETQAGHRLTPDTEIVVETTNFGVIGWVLVIASGIVLVVTTALRIKQVRSRQKRGPMAEEQHG